MDLKLTLALAVGKTTAFINQLMGTGATAAPGLYALKIDPNLVKKLTQQIKFGNIVISGTNGKTTTARLAANILATKFKIIHNRQGSNLLRGIASALITQASIFGKNQANLAIWEVDEATLPEVLTNMNPKVVCLLNLFRDQLDRYGEVDTTRSKWQKALANTKTTMIANADDPQTAFIGTNQVSKTIYFGVGDKKLTLPEISHVADVRHCLNCGSELNYESTLSAHLGHYTCPKCSFKRPKPNITAQNLKFNQNFSTQIELTMNQQLATINYSLPGLYNVYNVLAAASICDALKIDHTKIKDEIENFSAAFGRFQTLEMDGKKIIIFLIKNPAGANEVIRTLSIQKDLNLLTILNDNFADGRDVSWIWDTNWEILENKIKTLTISGIRRWDLALRLKYANFKVSKNEVETEINIALNASLSKIKPKEKLIILPTYTALLAVQKTLAKFGHAKWHKQ